MKTIKLFAMTAIAGLALGANVAKAQISAGVYGGLAIPTGDMSDDAKGALNAGFGGGVMGRYWLNDNMAVGANLDWTKNKGDEVMGLESSALTSCYMASFDYYFTDEGFKPFVGLQLGYVATKYKVEGTLDLGMFGTMPVSEESTNGGFGFAPVVGAAYGVNDNLDVFLNVKYLMGMNSSDDVDMNTTLIPINVGVTYKFD